MKIDRQAVFQFGHVYDSDAKEKIFKRPGKVDGSAVEFSVQIISGKRGIMHAILEQFPAFDRMRKGCSLNKLQTFATMVDCLSGNLQTIFDNIGAEEYDTDEKKKQQGAFNEARMKMITRTTKFECPRDEQLDFMRHMKFADYKLNPMEYQEEFSKTIRATKELEGTSTMPNLAEWNKILAESFPTEYQRYWLDSRLSYATTTMLIVARTMQTYYDRKQEDEPEATESDSDEDSDKKSADKSKKTKSNTTKTGARRNGI